MRKFTLALAGGFCGAVTRYALSAPLLRFAAGLPGAQAAFPFDILFINLSGAFLLGMLFGLFEHGAPISADVRLTLGTGFLGAYTTFSSYVVGADQLLAQGRVLAGILYVTGCMAGGIFLAYAGFHTAGLGLARWRDMASESVSEELLVDGGWDDPQDRALDTVVDQEMRTVATTSAHGERWPR